MKKVYFDSKASLKEGVDEIAHNLDMDLEGLPVSVTGGEVIIFVDQCEGSLEDVISAVTDAIDVEGGFVDKIIDDEQGNKVVQYIAEVGMVGDDVIEAISSIVHEYYLDDITFKLRSELDSDDVVGPIDNDDHQELINDIKDWASVKTGINFNASPDLIAEDYEMSQNYEDFVLDRLQYWMDMN